MSDVDAAISAKCERQHGVVSRGQLLQAGVPPHSIDYRVRIGRLRPLHRGVYQVGPIATGHSQEMAAVLACGEGAVVSHGSAARLWELVKASGRGLPVEVSAARGRRGRGKGVRLHRVERLDRRDVTRRHGVPVTAAARTILDLAARCGTPELERMVAHGERLRILRLADLLAVLKRYPSKPGASKLHGVASAAHGTAFLRSEAEARFLDLVRAGGVPSPATNAMVAGYEADFLWPRDRVVVEIDGFAYHRDRAAFERDRLRDARLGSMGYRVLRFTWRQLTRTPEIVLVHLAGVLAAAGTPSDRREDATD